MKIKFLGASQTVTGSCYLIETGDTKALIDCGMFQGPDVYNLNYEDFKFIPAEIDFVILTHAHLDHCGLLPKLCKDGFKGEIFTSQYTSKIASSIMLDSAKIQEKDATRNNNIPLYNTTDAQNAIGRIRTYPTNKEIEQDGLKIVLREVSHVLGAVSAEIYTSNTSFTFSGDIGRPNDRLIGHYSENYNTTKNIVMEALYGMSEHQDMDISIKELSNIINNTFKRDGIVMIPVFALHRSLLIIDILNQLIIQNKIPGNTKVILDSPLAYKIAEVYKEYNSRLNLENYPNLIYSKNQIRRQNKGKNRIILAGGGMANGGKILSYFKRNISKKNNSVIFVGFQAEDTLGREIVEGAKSIEIDMKNITVASEIKQLDGFSAHADRHELLEWLSRFDMNKIEKIFLTHAEIEKSTAFKEKLNELYPHIEVSIPDRGYEINMI